MGETFTVTTKELSSQVELLQSIVPKYPSNRILENIRLIGNGKSIKMTASDGDTTITTTCNYKGDMFSAVVPPIPLKKILSICGKKSEFNIHQKTVTITSDNHESVIPAFDVVDYPDYDIEEEPVLIIPMHSELCTAIKKSIAFVSNDELRVAMTRIMLDIKDTYITIVSTDAHSMFIEKFEIADNIEKSVLLPTNGLGQLMDENGTLKLYRNFIEFIQSDYSLQSRLDNKSKYPDYESVIPEKKNYIGKIGFNKTEFIDAVNKVLTLQYDNYSHIQIEFIDNRLFISSTDYNKEKRFNIWLDGAASGVNKPFKINSKILFPLLESLDGDFVYMNFTKKKNIIVLSSNTQKRYITYVKV